MHNLAQLIEAAVQAAPRAAFGTFRQQDQLSRVAERARTVAGRLQQARLARGNVVAVIGHNSGAYLVTWMAAQFAGLQAALINPAYPDELLGAMLDDLRPRAILWVGRDAGALQHRAEAQFDMSLAWQGEVGMGIRRDGELHAVRAEDGFACHTDEISAYIHTSGTTGRPKFCALSHAYFLRLGRFFADSLCLSRYDTVCAPLPLFHINPLGYGVLGALTAHCALLSMEKFQASEFWPEVRQHGVTALVLHAPPVSLLKAKTSREDASGHTVRIGFLCDPAFLRQFDVPMGVGGYGSTEAAGLCHSWHFRKHDENLPVEGATHMAGQPRHDIEHRIGDDGEIFVRAKQRDSIFSGYARSGSLDPSLDEEGWFATGDRGRLDAYGNLVFVERISDSIRVNGEYVPIDFVESRLRSAASLAEFALWRTDSATRGHDVLLFTTSPRADVHEIHAAMADLPKYMRPTLLIRIERIPRDPGVGKIQRRLLNDQPKLEVTAV